jgi:hypothetical protein
VQERVQVREVRVVQQAFKGKRDAEGKVVWTPVVEGSELEGMNMPKWDFGGMGGGGSGSGSGVSKRDGGSSSRR